jgi:hypothetical protein
MQAHPGNESALRLGLLGAILTVVGTLLSGPFAVLLVAAIQPQPAWESPQVLVANYHRIQSLPFYFGILLMSGSLMMIGSVYLLAVDKGTPLLALLFTSIAAGLIFLNYLTQATFIPALAESYNPALDPVITALSMVNPHSIAWALEMWGYGFLGMGTWLAAGFFANQGIERAAKILFVLNGVLSVIGTLWTSFDLGWVLSTAGLVSYGAWNLLYVILAVVFYIALNKRRTSPM